MKKRVLHIFTLIFGLLFACTFLSICIERQMTVKVTRIYPGKNTGMISADALVWDDTGTHLYQVAEGTGWEYGLRAAEISGSYYTFTDDAVQITSGERYPIIQYTSKSVSDGDLVEMVSAEPGTKETYLVLCPENFSLFEGLSEKNLAKLQQEVTVEGQSENIWLLSMTAELPFMEGSVRNYLSLPAGATIYRLEDTSQFFKNLPYLALLLVCFLDALLLWIFSGRLLCDPAKSRPLLWKNILIGVALAVCFLWGVYRIELPSSLLPQHNIFEIGHYAKEFSEIFESLALFDETAVSELINIVRMNLFLSAGILIVGLGFMLVVLVQEHACFRRKGKPSVHIG